LLTSLRFHHRYNSGQHSNALAHVDYLYPNPDLNCLGSTSIPFEDGRSEVLAALLSLLENICNGGTS
jgi:hypothetical protein